MINTNLIPAPAFIGSKKMIDALKALEEMQVKQVQTIFGLTVIESGQFPYVNERNQMVHAVMTNDQGMIIGSWVEGIV